LISVVMDRYKKLNFGAGCLYQLAQKSIFKKKKLLSPDLGMSGLDLNRRHWPALSLPWRSPHRCCLGGAHAHTALEEPATCTSSARPWSLREGCAYFGQPTPSTCPLRQAWGNLLCEPRSSVAASSLRRD
jgi:hypothetical protein